MSSGAGPLTSEDDIHVQGSPQSRQESPHDMFTNNDTLFIDDDIHHHNNQGDNDNSSSNNNSHNMTQRGCKDNAAVSMADVYTSESDNQSKFKNISRTESTPQGINDASPRSRSESPRHITSRQVSNRTNNSSSTEPAVSQSPPVGTTISSADCQFVNQNGSNSSVNKFSDFKAKNPGHYLKSSGQDPLMSRRGSHPLSARSVFEVDCGDDLIRDSSFGDRHRRKSYEQNEIGHGVGNNSGVDAGYRDNTISTNSKTCNDISNNKKSSGVKPPLQHGSSKGKNLTPLKSTSPYIPIHNNNNNTNNNNKNSNNNSNNNISNNNNCSHTNDSDNTEDDIFGDLVAKSISKVPEGEIKEELKIEIQQLILAAKRKASVL